VDHDTLELLIENMKHYPSASNARPIEITIVRSGELIKKLNDLTIQTLINATRLITSPLLMPVLHRLAPKKGIDKLADYKKQFIARQTPEASLICRHAPAVLLFHAPVSKLGMAGADAYIWATYTSIFANTMGLGSLFNGFIVLAMKQSRSMRKEFNIPDNHQVYAALLLGHPKVKYTNETGRSKPKTTVL
jgi:nitroreductase